MKKYYVPRRCISCDWNQSINLSYLTTEVTILQKVVTYKDNMPDEEYYVVSFPHIEKDGVYFSNKNKYKQVFENPNECQKECERLNLRASQSFDNSKLEHEM